MQVRDERFPPPAELVEERFALSPSVAERVVEAKLSGVATTGRLNAHLRGEDVLAWQVRHIAERTNDERPLLRVEIGVLYKASLDIITEANEQNIKALVNLLQNAADRLTELLPRYLDGAS